jgi:hypothetical protein
MFELCKILSSKRMKNSLHNGPSNGFLAYFDQKVMVHKEKGQYKMISILIKMISIFKFNLSVDIDQ